MKTLTVSSEHGVILKNIENTAHLTKDKDTGALLLHRIEEFVQDDHLAGVLD